MIKLRKRIRAMLPVAMEGQRPKRKVEVVAQRELNCLWVGLAPFSSHEQYRAIFPKIQSHFFKQFCILIMPEITIAFFWEGLTGE
jgi:hypothetical protein